MEKLKPKAVIFDLGSTLIDYPTANWEQVSDECLANAREYLVKRGYNLPDSELFCKAYKEIRDGYRVSAAQTLVEWTVTLVAEELLGKFGIDPDDELIEHVFDAYYEPLGQYLRVYDDVLETLERIRLKYSVTGLVSNTIFPEKAHKRELERFGIEPYLSFMVFSSTFGLRKPHRDIFARAANLAGVVPAECVYVGDRYVEDIVGPNRVGMAAILKTHELRDYPADMPESTRKIETLSQLEEHIDL